MSQDALISTLLRCYNDPFASDHDPRSLLKIAANALGETQFRIRELEDMLAQQRAVSAGLKARVTELEEDLT